MAGWGLKYNPRTKQYAVESTLKLANLEVNSREVCEEIFGKDNLRDNDINVRLLQRQIPRGFTSDITCVGNDFDVEQGNVCFKKMITHLLLYSVYSIQAKKVKSLVFPALN